jgi:hypothetical protein
MNIRDYAELAGDRVFAALEITPDDVKRDAVIDIIERQLLATAVDTRNWCANQVVQDNKVAKEARRQISNDLRGATEALIANLSSLR